MEALTLEAAAPRDETSELVARHRAGDPRAFAEIYERFSGMVYSLSLRLAGDPEDAADLTQEVFLRVYRYLGGFRGRSSLKTWIYRIGINQCHSRLGRRRLPAVPLAEEGAAETPPLVDPARGPEELALAADAVHRVAAALQRLPLVYREAVVLRDIDGLAYEEIAAVLGVRLGTVRSRIARGRDQLRALLETA